MLFLPCHGLILASTIENQGSRRKIQIYDKQVRIAIWNLRSLFMSRKLDNTEAAMTRMRIDVLGLTEVSLRQTKNQVCLQLLFRRNQLRISISNSHPRHRQSSRF